MSADRNSSDRSADDVSSGKRDDPLGLIQEALRGLRFGHVTVVVQDGVVVQIERLEKRRVRDRQIGRAHV